MLKGVYENPYVKIHQEGRLENFRLFPTLFPEELGSWLIFDPAIVAHLVRDTIYKRLCCRTAAEHMDWCQ